MPLQEGQVQIRDLVMGEGTRFRMMNEFNPFQIQVRTSGSGERAWNHGSWSAAEWAEARVVPMRILAIDTVATNTAGWMLAVQQLAAAFRPIGDAIADVDLRFMLGGREYLLRGRPRMLEPSTTHIGRGHGFVDAAFVALDPLIYSGTETVVGPLTLPTFTGGLTVPFTVPFTVDTTQVGGFADLVNDGTEDTGLLIRIDGPVDQPAVTLNTNGVAQTLRIDIDLTTGQWLDVDTAARTVLLNGATSWRGQTTGEFFELSPGTHRIDFRASNGTGTLTSRHRSAWW